MKKVVSLILALIMALSLVACGGGEKEEPKEKLDVQQQVTDEEVEVKDDVTYKKDLVIAYAQKHPTVDPQASATGIVGTLSELVYNQLITFNPTTGQMEPELAKSWTLSEDGLSWTFELRDDVKFSNGEPFTADDVFYTYEERARETGVTTSAITGAIKSIEVVDDDTVIINTNTLNVDLLYNLWDYKASIMNREACEADPTNGYQIGTNGWAVTDWVANEYASYARVDDSWVWADQMTPTETITFKIISEDSVRAMAVETGEVDLAFNPSLSDLEVYQSKEGLDVMVMPCVGLDYLCFDMENELLQDENLRKAIALAVDRQAILDVVFEGYGELAGSFWGWDAYGVYTDYDEPYEYNVEKAKEYLAKSNYNGETLNLASWNSNDYMIMAEVVQAQLNAIGVNVAVTNTDWATMVSMSETGDLDICLNNASMFSFGDRIRNFVDPASNANVTHYNNPEIMALIDEAVTETNDTARKDMYQEVQEIMKEEGWYYPIGFQTTRALYKEGFSGVLWRSTQIHDYSHAVCEE